MRTQTARKMTRCQPFPSGIAQGEASCSHEVDAPIVKLSMKKVKNLSKKGRKEQKSAPCKRVLSMHPCFENRRLRNYFIYNCSVYRRSLRCVSHRRFVMPAWPDCVAVRERLQRRFFNSAAVHLAT